MSRFSLALLAALLSATLSIARAEDEGRHPKVTDETRAASAQKRFNAAYELTDEVPERKGKEPDWKNLLRPSIRVPGQDGKPDTTYTPKVNYGVLLTGPATYFEGVEDMIPPASLSKLFTSSLALKELGGDFTYETCFSWRKSGATGDAGYLRITASGDPSIDVNNVNFLAEDFVQALVRDGVKQVYGDLVVDATDSRWNLRVVPEGWLPHDGTSDIPGALSTLSPARIKTALRINLLKAGIHWSGVDPVPFSEKAAVLSTEIHVSQPLRELIKPFMFHSINHMGEAFLRKVGEVKGLKAAPDLLTAALPLLREFANGKVGPHTVILNDGCGLSRTSRVSAAATVAFLTEMQLEPYFPDLFASLPTAGQTGTLDERMRGTAAAGRVHAKTGTLYTPTGNFQLAGYLVEMTKSGPEYHPFAILTSTLDSLDGYCRTTQDRVMAKLANWMLDPSH